MSPFKNWNVTVTYGEQTWETTVYAKDRAQALKFARNDVHNSQPFYKDPCFPQRTLYRAVAT